MRTILVALIITFLEATTSSADASPWSRKILGEGSHAIYIFSSSVEEARCSALVEMSPMDTFPQLTFAFAATSGNDTSWAVLQYPSGHADEEPVLGDMVLREAGTAYESCKPLFELLGEHPSFAARTAEDPAIGRDIILLYHRALSAANAALSPDEQ